VVVDVVVVVVEVAVDVVVVVVVVDVVVVVAGGAVVVVDVVVVVAGGAVVLVVVAVGAVVVVELVVVVVGGGGVVVVVVVVGTVVVVVPPAQLPAPHASQQLDCVPTQAVPPGGAVHLRGSPLTLHVTAPLAAVWQHVTEPRLPHVEFEAQPTTTSAHSLLIVPALTAWSATRLAQRTYGP